MDLSVDGIITLDVAVVGESDAPVGLGVVGVAGLSLGIVVTVVILDGPLNVVVRNVGLKQRIK